MIKHSGVTLLYKRQHNCDPGSQEVEVQINNTICAWVFYGPYNALTSQDDIQTISYKELGLGYLLILLRSFDNGNELKQI